MKLGILSSKRISFRVDETSYNSLYKVYEHYKTYSPNLTFSEFMRNLCLSFCVKVNENKTEN